MIGWGRAGGGDSVVQRDIQGVVVDPHRVAEGLRAGQRANGPHQTVTGEIGGATAGLDAASDQGGVREDIGQRVGDDHVSGIDSPSFAGSDCVGD